MNLLDVLRDTARQQPDRLAFIDQRAGERCTYGTLLRRIDASAEALAQSGVSGGQCVGLHCPSGLSYVVWAYAIWSRGATLVPVPVELPRPEIMHICKGIRVDMVISVAHAASSVRSRPAFAEATQSTRLNDDTFIYRLVKVGQHPPQFADINAAFVRFTSGTTANRKGVVLSHETVLERIHAANATLRIGPDDTIVWVLSMSYHFTVTIVGYLSFGACIVQCDNFFGKTLVEAVTANDATVIYASPAHFAMLALVSGTTMLPTLRLAISTTGPLKQETAERFLRRFGVPISQAYGIIEVGLPCINTDAAAEKPLAVGRPLPAYALRLRDVGLGAELRAIDVRGVGMLDAYYEPWQAQDTLLDDGWFATGDLGYCDGDGYLYVVDRSNAVINVAGMKAFPQEIEVALEQCPGISQAFVYGVPHSSLSEVPVADVVVDPFYPLRVTEQDLYAFCVQRLARHKVPVSFRFVTDLPRTASGKLRRRTPLGVGGIST